MTQEDAQKVISESNALKDVVGEYKELTDEQENLEMTLRIITEEPDEEMQEELGAELKEFKTKLEEFELQMLLSDEFDKHNAVLELHSGAGGTESQDWASMLLRMYTALGRTTWVQSGNTRLSSQAMKLVLNQ